jgi:signal transduction histidine kinase
LKKIFNRFSDDKKFFSIVFFILLLIVLLGVISPIITNKTRDNWNVDLSGRISDIREGMNDSFQKKQNLLVKKSNLVSDGLTRLFANGDSLSARFLFKVFASDFYEDVNLGIYDGGLNLISWTENYNISDFPEDMKSFHLGETFFYNDALFTFLAKADSIKAGGKTYYLFWTIPVEKYFSIDNKYINKVSFSEKLSNKYLCDVDIVYKPETERIKDSKRSEFPLLNNRGHKIGSVSFSKPLLNTELSGFSDKIDLLQSLLIVCAAFIIGFGFRKDFSEIKFRTVRLAVISVYCILLRVILFEVGFPSNILEGSIVNPNNFSSPFAYGLVKSPVELFITSAFCFVIAFQAYRFFISYISEEKRKRLPGIISYAVSSVLVVAFLFLVRGFAAIIRSVIFDSTLRYFKDADLIPDSASLLMNFNVFIIGFVIVIFLLLFLLSIIRLLKLSDPLPKKRFFTGMLILSAVNLAFILIQENPLINFALSFFIVIVIGVLLYHIHYIKRTSVYNYVYIALAGSIISIVFLNFFNSVLEKESLKTIALELNRPNENMLRFYVDKTLNEAASDNFVRESFSGKPSALNSAAFSIWSNSPLHKESVEYYVFLLDKNKKIRGYFSNSLKSVTQVDPILYSYLGAKAQIYESASGKSKKTISGIIAVNAAEPAEAGSTGGFIAVSVNYSGVKINSEFSPEFLLSSKNIFNDVLNSAELSVFTFENGKLLDSYGNLYLSKYQTSLLLSDNFSEFNEKWTRIPVTGENYLFYVLKVPIPGQERYTAIALREKQISINMYNFFKLFLIHSIFILILVISIAFTRIKKPYAFRLSFRTQLLTAFLFMSLIPILSLAVYNRHVVNEKSRQSILNELKERAEIVENTINLYNNRNEDSLYADIFRKVAVEQKINFSLFKNQDEIFSSVNSLTSVGIMPKILNPRIYNRLLNSGFREYSGTEKLDKLEYTSYNKKITVDSAEYILNINSAVNRINVSISSLDIDIFLFGVYSFAAIIIAVLGTVLANKISSPIRRLTKATSSVAHGDFNLQMQNNEKGEIRDLINGFNLMTKELSKRQSELAELERETAWKEMARQVAHEIKNPLTPMKLAIQQLIIASRDNHPSFNTIFEKVTTTVLNQIDTLNTIATEFSNFARMPNYNLEEIDIIPVIKDSLNLFMDEKIKIDFSTRLTSAVVDGDVSQIRRIIINLARNSIQAGATMLKVTVSEAEGKYAVSVADNGNGIPEDLKNRIFEQNFTTKNLGMGLGLKLAKKFIESVGGKIYLKTSSLNGSEFIIQLNKKSA